MADVAPNTSAEVVLAWADGEYKFALKLKQCDELQRIVGSWSSIIEQLFSMRPSPRLVYETIRLGLIGGGMDDVKAKQLVDTYVEGRGLFPSDRDGNLHPSGSGLVAKAIVSAVHFGLEEFASTKKEQAATAEATE